MDTIFHEHDNSQLFDQISSALLEIIDMVAIFLTNVSMFLIDVNSKFCEDRMSSLI